MDANIYPPKCRSGIIKQNFHINQLNTFPTIIQYRKKEDVRSGCKTNKQHFAPYGAFHLMK